MKLLYLAFTASLAAACADRDGSVKLGQTTAPSGPLLGQSGTEPDFCDEISRTEVMDTSAIPEGFDFSVDELLLVVTGPWSGSLEIGDEPLAFSLTLQRKSGPIYAINTYRSGGPESADQEPDECSPFYEIPLSAEVQSSGLLQESFAVLGSSRAADDLRFVGELAADEVIGSTAPSFEPESFDSTVLVVMGRATLTYADGWVQWRGVNDPDSEPAPTESCEVNGFNGCLDSETGDCGPCGGSVGLAGIVESVGFFDTIR